MTAKEILKLTLCILGIVALGSLSGIATAQGVQDWYPTLTKPSFNPPSWIFGPVWTLLYALMGCSLYFILQSKASRHKSRALLLFCVQMVFNLLWSVIFFALHQTGWALMEIILMWISILLMIRALAVVRPLAAYIQVPYLLWVSFATILNGAIYFLNI